MEFSIKAIGVIHTPLTDKKSAPIQSSRSEIIGIVEVYTQYLEGLEGIEAFSHIYLLYKFHQADQETALIVMPFLDDQEHGVFATRHPNRPNPLGLSVVQLISRQANLIKFMGADMLDGTPLLDIKPYIPEFDVFSVDKTGWFQTRKLP